jgi:hypothetical protein
MLTEIGEGEGERRRHASPWISAPAMAGSFANLYATNVDAKSH